MANKKYVNYKNRFFVADPSIQQQHEQQQHQQPIPKTSTSVPTTINNNPITYDIGDDQLPEFGDGSKKNHQAPINPSGVPAQNPAQTNIAKIPPTNPVKQKPPYIYSDTSPNKNASNRIGQTSISTRLGSLGNYLN